MIARLKLLVVAAGVYSLAYAGNSRLMAQGIAQEIASETSPGTSETIRGTSQESPATQSSEFDFSIRNIMRGPELYGREPQNIRWALDGRSLLFRWLEPGARWNEPLKEFRVMVNGGETTPIAVAQPYLDSIAPLYQTGSPSPDGKQSAVAYKGDLYIVEHASGAIRTLTSTVQDEYSPVFGVDGRTVYYASGNNIYSIDIASGTVRQLTDLRTEDKPLTPVFPERPQPKDSQKARLMRQQVDLFTSVRDRIYSDSVRAVEQKLSELNSLRPIYLGRDRVVQSVSISPAGDAALIITTKSAETSTTDIPYFVTESGYTEVKKMRPKVGDAGQRYTISMVALKESSDQQSFKVFEKVFDNDSSPSYIEFGGWNKSGSTAIFYAFRPDNKQRILYSAKASEVYNAPGTLTAIETLTDTAWVGGPCVTCLGWLPDDRTVWYMSEATGFAHLYTSHSDGSNRRQLTAGNWEVRDVALSVPRSEFIITANRISPFEEQVYSLDVKGGELRQLTQRSGGHTATVSPDGKTFANVYSYVNIPPDLYLQSIDGSRKGNTAPRRVTQSPSAEWLSQSWVVPERVMIPASDGESVPAHMYHPKDFGAEPNGAAVIFVHGAGYLHNVGNFWSMYPREYMFNQLLAKSGYIVLDLDYRASDGYGRDWRTAIYRWMGGRDLQDHVDASRWLTSTHGVPPERVGIYGGSYGGFITLMALFTAPDYFGAGAALRSVTDWAHYNRGYTSNILNLPQDDTLAYRRSSPIYFAEGLRAPLLMAHGMVDINVHYQDIVRLTQKLIELEKEDWELASYPVEDHAFLDPKSWADEYLRIFRLFERVIGRNGSEQ